MMINMQYLCVILLRVMMILTIWYLFPFWKHYHRYKWPHLNYQSVCNFAIQVYIAIITRKNFAIGVITITMLEIRSENGHWRPLWYCKRWTQSNLLFIRSILSDAQLWWHFMKIKLQFPDVKSQNNSVEQKLFVERPNPDGTFEILKSPKCYKFNVT